MNTAVDIAIRAALPVLHDAMTMDALASHLNVGELKAIADIFRAAGHHDTYHDMMHATIHGDYEVRAVAHAIEYGNGPAYALIYRDGMEEDFYTRIHEGSIEDACERLMLEVEEEDVLGRTILKSECPS